MDWTVERICNDKILSATNKTCSKEEICDYVFNEITTEAYMFGSEVKIDTSDLLNMLNLFNEFTYLGNEMTWKVHLKE